METTKSQDGRASDKAKATQRQRSPSQQQQQQARLPCDQCDASFSRMEHLARHRRSHTSDKPFCCPRCSKRFTRRDTLNRHIPIHYNEGNGHRLRSVSRVSKACTSCAHLRLRCDGNDPCERCISRDSQCVYTPGSRMRIMTTIRKSSQNINGGPDATTSDNGRTESEGGSHKDGSESGDINVTATNDNGMDTGDDNDDDKDMDGIDVTDRTDQTDATDDANSFSAQLSSMSTPSSVFATATSLPGDVSLLADVDPVLQQEQQQHDEQQQSQRQYEQQPAPTDYEHMALHTLTQAAIDLGGAPYSTMDDTNMSGADTATAAVISQQDAPLVQAQQETIASTILDLDFPMPWSHDLSLMDWISPQSLEPPADNNFNMTFAYDTPSMMFGTGVPQFQLTPVSESPQVTCDDGNASAVQGIISQSQAMPAMQTWPQPTNGGDVSQVASNQIQADPNPQQTLQDTRAAITHQWITEWDPTSQDNIVAFPDMSRVTRDILEAEELAQVESIGSACYSEIARCLRRHAGLATGGTNATNSGSGATGGGGSRPHYRDFTNANLPPFRAMNCFVQLYFEHFQGIFPMLHQGTFHPAHQPWQLVLAVAAIGCRYSKLPGTAQFADALQELLRRAIADTIESDNSVARATWMCQCIILNSLGMSYSGNKRLLEVAEIKRNTPATMVRRIGCLSQQYSDYRAHQAARGQSDGQAAVPPASTDLDREWKAWVAEEAFRRLGFCAFFSDAQISMHLDLMPCMSATELHRPLPDHDSLWNAPDAETWQARRQKFNNPATEMVTLSTGMQLLADHQPLPSRLGSFARLIMVMSTYQTAVAMANNVMSSLFAGLSETRIQPTQVTQRAIGLIEALRPTANQDDEDDHRDDLLRASLECHVTLTLMLLHTHRRDILSLAHASAKRRRDAVDKTTTAVDSMSLVHEIIRQRLSLWIREDGGKRARGAALHAGRLWAVLRQSSTHGFHEPIAALLAILVLWCYNQMFAENTSISPGDASAHLATGSVVRLDRPRSTSDSRAWQQGQVQARFVPHLQGVGNITRQGAGDKILDAGRMMLHEMDIWALSHAFATWLGKMRTDSL